MEDSLKVWDPLIRIFHWSLVASFITAYLTAEEYEGAHAIAGYAVSGLLIFRFVWGFLGTKHARFRDFVYGPREIIGYLKGLFGGTPKHYLGHNPAGGLMIIILLITLFAVCISGLKAYGEEGLGPLAAPGFLVSAAYADDDDDDSYENGSERNEGEELWEEMHEIFVNCSLFLIAVHLSGVAVSSYLHKENLIKAMITGRKEIRRN